MYIYTSSKTVIISFIFKLTTYEPSNIFNDQRSFMVRINSNVTSIHLTWHLLSLNYHELALIPASLDTDCPDTACPNALTPVSILLRYSNIMAERTLWRNGRYGESDRT